MRIRLTKLAARNQLLCVRSDGTSVVADLGPSLPYHDLAHWVVERTFELNDGFFGNIARGFSPAQLADKGFIKGLGKNPLRAEVLARALGSVHTGACEPEQFEELVNAELRALPLDEMHIALSTVEAMMSEYHQLVSTYSLLRTGESMELFVDGLDANE